MPDDEPAQKFLFRLVWPPTPTSGRKHTLVETLRELQQTHKDFLTDEEYRQIRSELMDELATRSRMPVVQLGLWTLGALVGVAMSAFMVAGNVPRSAWVGALPFGVCAIAGVRLYRDYARKRDLTRSDRIAAVDELAAGELVSAEEAAALKGRIENVFPK